MLQIKAAFSKSIFLKLLVTFVLVVLAPALLISIVSAISNYQIAKERVLNQLESVATLKSAEIELWSAHLNTSTDLLIHNQEIVEYAIPLFRGKLSEEAVIQLRKDMNTAILKAEVFTHASLIDVSGRVILSTDPSQENLNVSGAPFFAEGFKKRLYQPAFPAFTESTPTGDRFCFPHRGGRTGRGGRHGRLQ